MENMELLRINGKKDDLVLFFLIVLMYVSFFLPMGSAVPTLLLLIYYIFTHKFKIRIQYSIFIFYIFLFVAFCYLTVLWATKATNVLVYANHLLKTLFGITVLYLCVFELKSVDLLLKAMIVGGYILLVYVVCFYGISGVILILSESSRMTNEVMNANVFAMCISYACILHIYYGVKNKKWTLLHLLIIPSIAILAVSGSRKGLIVLAGGILGIVIWNNFRRNKSITSVIKLIVSTALILLSIYLVLQMPIFSFLNTRVSNYFSFLQGSDDVDNSLIARSKFIEIGFEIFKNHPLVGVGLDNARLYNYRDVYLHNNFIEMLADGGLIGFCVYYWFYLYLFIKLLKNRRKGVDNFAICFILLILFTLVHYAHVAYRTSNEYYMLMIVFLEVCICNKSTGSLDKNNNIIHSTRNE